MDMGILLLCFAFLMYNAPLSLSLQCYNCLVTVNTGNYVPCKLLEPSIKKANCPSGSPGCAVVRYHPKGKFAEFRRECIDKTFTLTGPNSYCEKRKINDTQANYFNCNTCQGDGCNKVLLR